MGYVIRNTKNNTLFWNNLYGWGNYVGCQAFPNDAPQTLKLPIDGKWLANLKVKGQKRRSK